MSNELAKMLSKSNASQSNLGNILSMIKGIKNPNEMIMNLAKNNPQANMLLNTLKNGGNPKEMFYEIAKQKGINADEILEIARNLSTCNNS